MRFGNPELKRHAQFAHTSPLDMTIQLYTYTQIKVNEQLVVRKDMDVNEHNYSTLHLDTN